MDTVKSQKLKVSYKIKGFFPSPIRIPVSTISRLALVSQTLTKGNRSIRRLFDGTLSIKTFIAGTLSSQEESYNETLLKPRKDEM